jgi:hypothetical protein
VGAYRHLPSSVAAPGRRVKLSGAALSPARIADKHRRRAFSAGIVHGGAAGE